MATVTKVKDEVPGTNTGDLYVVESDGRTCYLATKGHTAGVLNKILNNQAKLEEFVADMRTLGGHNAIQKSEGKPLHIPKTEKETEDDEATELATLLEAGDYDNAARKMLGFKAKDKQPK